MENIRLRELYPDEEEEEEEEEEGQASKNDKLTRSGSELSSGFTGDDPLYSDGSVYNFNRSIGDLRHQEKPTEVEGSQGGIGLESKNSPDTEYVFDSPPPIPLSVDQQRILDLVLEGHNVFFSGPAGSGKSLILQHIQYHLKKKGVTYAVTAPTGIAAVLIGGRTIYSWSGVGKGEKGVDYYVAHAKKGAHAKQGALVRPKDGEAQKKAGQETFKGYKSGNVWMETMVLIIDEVSMLSPDLFEKLDKIARASRYPYNDLESTQPFGRIQLVICGDFFQLPPVDVENNKTCYKCGEPVIPVDERKYLGEKDRILKRIPHLGHIHAMGVDSTRWTVCTRKVASNGASAKCNHLWNDTTKYCFQTQTWSQIKFRSALLTKVYRQQEQSWVEMLSKIKIGEVSGEILDFLNSLRRPLEKLASGIKPTRLYTYRRDVERENQEEFDKLPSKMHEFRAIDKGVLISKDHLKVRDLSKEELDAHHYFKGLPVPKDLKLKHDAQVMLLSNIDISSRLVNGSRGVVSGFALYSREKFLEIASHQKGCAADANPQKGMFLDYFDTHSVKGKIRVPLVKFVEKEKEKEKEKETSNPRPVMPICWSADISQWYSPVDKNTLHVRRVQIPLGLAWATTIHKSQGGTLDYVAVDVGGAFAPGQAYVGLSRCRTTEGMQILGSNEGLARAFLVDKGVIKFHSDMKLKAEQDERGRDRVKTVDTKVESVGLEDFPLD